MFYRGLLLTAACAAANVYVPKDRVTNKHRGHAFVEFKSEEDAEYVRAPATTRTEPVCRPPFLLLVCRRPLGSRAAAWLVVL